MENKANWLAIYPNIEMVVQRMNNTYKYCRVSHNQYKLLAYKLVSKYKELNCIITPSGLAAISCVINARLENFGDNIHVFYANDLRLPTLNLIQSIIPIYKNIKSAHEIIITDRTKETTVQEIIESIRSIEKKQKCILLLENHFFNFEMVYKIKSYSEECLVVIDDTFGEGSSATSLDSNHNPLKHGADILVTSLNKYANVPMGCAITSNNCATFIERFATKNGMHISPYDTQLIINNLNNENKNAELIERIHLTNPTIEHKQLCSIIKNFYTESNNYKSLVVPSGIAAISCAINGLFNYFQDDIPNVFYSDKLFQFASTSIISILTMQYNSSEQLEDYGIDVTDSEEIIEKFIEYGEDMNNILFLETCSNPDGFIFDFDIIARLREISKNLVVIVNNTWLSSIAFNPLEYKVDIVVNSLSKYYSGCTAIGGAIITDDRYYNDIFMFALNNGMHMSHENAKIIYKNIHKVQERIIKTSKKTEEIIKRYKKRFNIIHPMLENSPSYELAIKYFKYWPSVFIIALNGSNVFRLIENSNIELKTSYGCNTTRFDKFSKTIDGITYYRLAIGYNDEPNLFNRLDAFFEHFEFA